MRSDPHNRIPGVRSGRLGAVAILALVAAAALPLIGGCERRVVRTHNNFAGSSIDDAKIVRVGGVTRVRSSQKGPLEKVGDTLFGWTDGLFSDDRGDNANQVDLSRRQGSTTSSSGTLGSWNGGSSGFGASTPAGLGDATAPSGDPNDQ